jgi:hypothetical protein
VRARLDRTPDRARQRLEPGLVPEVEVDDVLLGVGAIDDEADRAAAEPRGRLQVDGADALPAGSATRSQAP